MDEVRGRNRRRVARHRPPEGLSPILPEVYHRFLDISIGGMRVLSTSLWQRGDLVKIEIRFPTGTSLLTTCEVVWTQTVVFENAPGIEAGLRFTDLSDFDRSRIGALLAGSGSV